MVKNPKKTNSQTEEDTQNQTKENQFDEYQVKNQEKLMKLYESTFNLNRQRLDLEANEDYEQAADIKEALFIRGEELKRMTIDIIQQGHMNEREELEQQYEFELINLEE